MKEEVGFQDDGVLLTDCGNVVGQVVNVFDKGCLVPFGLFGRVGLGSCCWVAVGWCRWSDFYFSLIVRLLRRIVSFFLHPRSDGTVEDTS